MVTILIMSAKIVTVAFLKITVFLNKGYDLITSVHDVTNKILLRDLNYVVDAVIRPKIGNSNISLTEVIVTSILYGFDQKNHFF